MWHMGIYSFRTLWNYLHKQVKETVFYPPAMEPMDQYRAEAYWKSEKGVLPALEKMAVLEAQAIVRKQRNTLRLTAETPTPPKKKIVEADPIRKKVLQSIKDTWMEKYPFDPALELKTDAELESLAKSFPRRLEADEPREALIATVWMERKRRAELAKLQESQQEQEEFALAEATGQWRNKTPFPQEGERVTTMMAGLFGRPSVVGGTAHRKKDGRWIVRIEEGHGGAKTTPLTSAWRPVRTSNPLPASLQRPSGQDKPAVQEWIGGLIRFYRSEGRPPDQAVAIAYATARKLPATYWRP